MIRFIRGTKFIPTLVSAALALAVSLSVLAVPSEAKVLKPNAPRVSKIVSGTKYKAAGKSFVNLTVTVSKAAAGASPTAFTVSVGKFKCTAKLPKSSCVITKVPFGTSVKITAIASNAGGNSAASSAVSFKAGMGNWPALASAPTITSASASNTNVSLSFTAPSSAGGSTITNYAYSIDGGQTWKTRTPPSTASPLTILGVNAGSRVFKIRAISSAGSGAASAGKTFVVPATSRKMLPIKFKPLTNAQALVLTSSQNLRSRASAAGSVIDSTQVSIVLPNGNLDTAVDSQNLPINIDRIFIGPTGRTIATLGSNTSDCSLAEINRDTGDAFCVATREQASLINVELIAQQIGGLVPVKFDAVGNVFISSFESLLRIDSAGKVATLIPQSANYCIQGWTPLSDSSVVAWVNNYALESGCSGAGKTIMLSGANGSIAEKTICDCAIESIAATPDGGAFLSNYQVRLKLASDGTTAVVDNVLSETLSWTNFGQARLLGNGSVVAIPQYSWGQLHSNSQPTPLMQYFPIVESGPQPTFAVNNVPVPMLLSKMGDSKVVVAGLADALNCWRYASIWDVEAACMNTARLSIYDTATMTETPIDLVAAEGGNTDPMNIFFLSAKPDGSTIFFAGTRFRTTGMVIGITDVVGGSTTITAIDGFLGLSAY